MTKNLVVVMGLILSSSVSMASTVECGLIRMTESNTSRIAETTLDCSKNTAKVVYSEIGGIVFACENDGSEIKIAVVKTPQNLTISQGQTLSASKTSFSSYYLNLNEDLVTHCSLK
jgi:hypothetical protein